MTEILKLVLVGESGVGKSWLFGSFFGNGLSEITIGYEFKVQLFEIKGRTIGVNIWDTAGTERFRSLTAAYYRGANAVACVYDITRYDSFSQIKKFWIDEVKKYIEDDAVIMLIGTKLDLEKDRQVSSSEVIQYAMDKKFFFSETSALQNINVQSTFMKLVEEAYKQRFENRLGIPENSRNVIRLERDSEVEEVKKDHSKNCSC
ncbi:hypothetical protein FO519_004942 [Halicephalobus sp. NKZ332]|nr:hypothetical protein FO519_004942 [Halicephalobus sp. NKZ332]